MQIAIDSYCYHRYFGEVYPGLETAPDHHMTLEEVIDRATGFAVEGVSLESFMLDDTSPIRLEKLRKHLGYAGLVKVWAWGHPDGLGSETLKRHGYSGLLALEIDYLHPHCGHEDKAIANSLDYLHQAITTQQN